MTDVAGALARADVVVLALPGPAVAGLVSQHSAALDGRLVIDATNTMSGGPANSHDVITTTVPGVRYARAFNTLCVENLREPEIAGERADMFFSAADADRSTVADLIHAVGLRPVWVGENTHDTVDGMLRLAPPMLCARTRRPMRWGSALSSTRGTRFSAPPSVCLEQRRAPALAPTASSEQVAGSYAALEIIMLVSPMTTPAVLPERHTGHIDALLGDVSARGARPPLRYLNWVARTFGPTVAAELERQRRAQYGFCPIGHVRAVRTARTSPREIIGAQLFCPECERCAA